MTRNPNHAGTQTDGALPVILLICPSGEDSLNLLLCL